MMARAGRSASRTGDIVRIIEDLERGDDVRVKLPQSSSSTNGWPILMGEVTAQHRLARGQREMSRLTTVKLLAGPTIAIFSGVIKVGSPVKINETFAMALEYNGTGPHSILEMEVTG